MKMLAGGRVWWLVSVLWMALIFVASSQPALAVTVFEFNDKVAHALVYAALGYFLLRALTDAAIRVPFGFASVYVITWVALYGAFDEWHQSFVPGRIVSLGDWAADVGGAALAVCLAKLLSQRSSS